MSESETTQASSGATDAPARKADVIPTAVFQIAQKCAEAVCDGRWQVVATHTDIDGVARHIRVPEGVVAERLERALNAINASMGEGTKPNA